MIHLTPMLAINQVELIAAILGIVIVVGGWISKAMQKGQQNGMNQGSLGADERRRKLEELAARRRQQLEDLARQRRAGAQTGAPTPSNLTAGEAQQRNTAREMYERRAEALRQLRQQQSQVQSGTTFPSTSARPAPPTSARPTPAPTASRSAPPTAPQQAQDLARQRAQQMARLRQKREQELAAQRQRARQEQERIARQQQARKPAPPPRREEPVLEAQAVLEEITETPAGGVQSEAFVLTGKGRRGLAGLNATAMRHAIILKEILDPPVSMREPRGL